MVDIARPQALAAFPLPFGLLLVPDGPGHDTVRDALVRGRLPQEWPPGLAGHEHAAAGRTDEALAAFAGDDPTSRFNRLVLDPDAVDADALRADLPGGLAPLVDVVGYLLGRTDEVPSAEGTDGEVAAVVGSARASAALAEGDAATAVRLLREAALACPPEAAPLAALLRGNAGSVAHESGLEDPAVVADLTAAVTALADTDLTLARAELHHRLATVLHEVPDGLALNPAVHHYYSVLQLVSEEEAPELWASAHLGLGTAYLMMPMTQASDSLRSAVAIQSLRAARRVLTADTHPTTWSSATLNLANALVYSPSQKQGDNLVEAVELYEEVLAVRDRDTDPLGRARVLANQGNALAHLGVFDQAKAKLYEARFVFEEHLDHDSVMMVRSILDEVARATVPKPLPDDGSDPAGAAEVEEVVP